MGFLGEFVFLGTGWVFRRWIEFSESGIGLPETGSSFQGAELNFPRLANFARFDFFKPSEQRREREPEMKWNKSTKTTPAGGVAGWLLGRLRAAGGRQQPKLGLLERIALAPRQSLSLVEAEGRRFLVATSPEGAPAFYALDERPLRAVNNVNRQRGAKRPAVRVSW